jgi:orotidine-5'-phosphate decarboxylase
MPSTQINLLSSKLIRAADRLIFPLDVPSNEDALRLVETLGDTVHFYKVGLELLLGGKWIELVDALEKKGKAVMLDVKIFDVPETVKAAVRQAVKQHVRFVTVHASDEALKGAVEVKNGVQILAVTVLTSVNKIDREEFGFECSVEELVLSRAKRALEIGCDGVISSGLEAPQLRKSLGHKFLIVTPGIRPVDNTEIDDQKRTVDVEEAFKNGADYIVVGRPIRKAPDPQKAAADIQNRIAKVFEK